MKEQLKKLGGSVAKAVTAMGFTKNGKGMGHRQGLDIIAKTGGIKCWQAVAALKDKSTGVLTLNPGMENEYTMNTDAVSCHIRFGGHNIYIKREADGIIIDVDAYGTLTGDIISTLGVTNNDIEEDLLESYGLDGDEVAEWVGLHYKVNFDTESYFKRYEWIERYIESNSV